MAVSGTKLLLINGVPQTGDIPPVVSFLESTSGAYTTTRTHQATPKLLFWDRHITRLTESVRILSQTRPDLLGPGSAPFLTDKSLQSLTNILNHSLRVGFDLALTERTRYGCADELAITALVRSKVADSDNGLLDVFLHIGFYLPPVFGVSGARLAVVGPGRDLAFVKYSDWVRMRKELEKLRPPNVTGLVLTNDGDRILEGSISNFFVVCRKSSKNYDVELQTAPINSGVLPGVIRQLVIEVCSDMGIPLREIEPSWSERDLWEEAFVTSSLRIVQHVETIQAPLRSEDLSLKTWKDLNWVSKSFEGLGRITTLIQNEIMRRVEEESRFKINRQN